MAISALIADMQRELDTIATDDPALAGTRAAALRGVSALREAVDHVLEAGARSPDSLFAVSVPFLKLCGIVAGGWLMARSAAIAQAQLAAGATDRDFLRGKLATARFYAAQVLPQVHALLPIVAHGAASVVETDAALL